MNVLVTGAGNFLGLHVIDMLMQHGHDVVATVKSDREIEDTKAVASKHPKCKLQHSVVKDATQKGAYDEALKMRHIESVVDVDLPMFYHDQSGGRKLFDHAVDSINNLLTAVSQHSLITRFVLSSSLSTCVDDRLTGGDTFLNEAEWAYTDPQAANSDDEWVKTATTFREKALVDFIGANSPSFDFTTINQSLLVGPTLGTLKVFGDLDSHSKKVLELCRGIIPQDTWGEYIDVRESAKAHAEALHPEYGNKRWLVLKEDYVAKKFVQVSQLGTPDDSIIESKVLANKPKIDASTFLNDTKMKFRSLKESLVDMLTVIQNNLT